MPIDPASERPLYPLSAVAHGKVDWFVNPKTGSPFSFSSIRRFHARGIRGVRLEAIRMGDTLVTSEAALRRFVERMSEAGIPVGEAGNPNGVADDGTAAYLAKVGL
ncbi:MAG TPA: DUF1580 domain-containing protein [Tepidisphaeraceae bacterium]|jgi:hypothetical protein|nr:DUF1580 domain-containing protein [Tepidisphaeraceae bacterium]